MTSSRILMIVVLAFTAALAGCNERKDPGFQGWVEADMIFVSPDETAVLQNSTCAKAMRSSAAIPFIPSTHAGQSRRRGVGTARR